MQFHVCIKIHTWNYIFYILKLFESYHHQFTHTMHLFSGTFEGHMENLRSSKYFALQSIPLMVPTTNTRWTEMAHRYSLFLIIECVLLLMEGTRRNESTFLFILEKKNLPYEYNLLSVSTTPDFRDFGQQQVQWPKLLYPQMPPCLCISEKLHTSFTGASTLYVILLVMSSLPSTSP